MTGGYTAGGPGTNMHALTFPGVQSLKNVSAQQMGSGMLMIHR